MNTKTGAGLGAALLLVLLGIFAANQPPPAPAPASTTTTTARTTTTTSPPAATDTAAPFFAPTASWNRPAAELGFSTRWQPYAARFWAGAGGTAPPGTVNLAFTDYSVPIYDAAKATTTARFYQADGYARLFSPSNTGLTVGAAFPWNPTWKPAPGNDALLIIIDRAHDQWWELGGLNQLPINCAVNLANAAAGYDPTRPDHLCGGGIQHGTGLYGRNLFTGRGLGGLPKLALITRADEVASGRIRHALELTITGTMWGEPTCAPDAPGAGDSCGFYLPPATRVEWSSGSATRCAPAATPPRTATVPEGMRFALAITDQEIDAWLTTRGYTGPIRSTARTFAVALRDYGWIIAETGCYGTSIELDGLVNPDSAATWARLGIPSQTVGGPLLNGLITPDRIRVVEPTA